MLAALLQAPKTPEDWIIWSNHHRDSHTRIRQAIQTQKNVSLIDYQIDPISQTDIQGFLQRNSQLHGDMLGVLGLQAEDILDVDFKNQSQAEAWAFLHYQDHYNAENALRI